MFHHWSEPVECSVDDSQLCRNPAFDAEMVGSLGFQIKSAVLCKYRNIVEFLDLEQIPSNCSLVKLLLFEIDY